MEFEYVACWNIKFEYHRLINDLVLSFVFSSVLTMLCSCENDLRYIFD